MLKNGQARIKNLRCNNKKNLLPIERFTSFFSFLSKIFFPNTWQEEQSKCFKKISYAKFLQKIGENDVRNAETANEN